LRLRVLTGMERDKIREEYEELMQLINRLKAILADEGLRMQIIKDELAEIRTKYGDERRTNIIYAADEQRIEDLIADEDVVITISHLGYIKRTLLSEYRAQNRGGRGSRGSGKRGEDYVEHLFTATTHNYLLFFTEQGRCFWMRAYEVPEGDKTSKGRAIQNMINLPPSDKVKAYINVKTLSDPDYINNTSIVMVTLKGIIKKTRLEAYSRPRANGINAITVRDGDMLLEAILVTDDDQIMVASKQGRVVRFEQSIEKDGERIIKFRAMGRNASGVRAMNLVDATNEVVGMIAIPRENRPQILVVSEKGYGKRSSVDDENGEAIYRTTSRGGKGVKTINITEKTGNLVAIKAVSDDNDLMIITSNGILIRLSVADLRVMGRATQGVRLINLQGEDGIAAVTVVESDPEEEHAQVDGTVDTTMADVADDSDADETAPDADEETGTDVESEGDDQ
ncbi:MAG: DNA gyrase C-terminal beta-propeller domain-containing protein, partial [Bacteroidia bacterium]